MERKGLILWLTGFSGSGKSTIAKGLERELREHAVVWLRF
jgi:adenylylsulfate kinase